MHDYNELHEKRVYSEIQPFYSINSKSCKSNDFDAEERMTHEHKLQYYLYTGRTSMPTVNRRSAKTLIAYVN